MLYYALGDALVSSDELFETTTLNEVTSFFRDLGEKKIPSPIALSTGELTSENVVTAFDKADGGGQVEFKPIGPGLPLNVMIREVYTGKYPKGGGKDMLVTSAIKGFSVVDAKPRALNFLKKKVASKTRLERPPASSQGTPIIYYSPALLERSLTLDLTMVFDTFPQETFNQVGDAFTAAAGIPVFLAHSVFLIAAGIITKLIGKVGEAIFDGKPVFDSSDALDISLPGSQPLPAGFALITSGNVDQTDPDFRKNYQVNSSGQVVDKTGNQYNGDTPYVVISLDGTSMDELVNFAPTAVSAALLTRFFGIKDGQQMGLEVLIDALKVYNDLTFRKQIDAIDKQLAGMPAGPKKDELQKKRDALLANILEDVLKPKATA
jgi:hypothetical protein